MDARALAQEVQKGGFTSRLLSLEIDGRPQQVLPRDLQTHPVTDAFLHVDFLRVARDAEVTIMVPTNFVDEEECAGLRRGGVLNVVRHEVELICRADAIPEEIRVSLKDLDIGDSVHISAVDLPEGVRPTITDRDFTIATIAAPTVHREPEEEVAEEAPEEALEEGAEAPAEAEAPAAAEEAEEKGTAE